jgi:hypothetical protein
VFAEKPRRTLVVDQPGPCCLSRAESMATARQQHHRLVPQINMNHLARFRLPRLVSVGPVSALPRCKNRRNRNAIERLIEAKAVSLGS